MATATYHHVDGMSMTEYEELVKYLKNRFVWGGKKYDVRLIRAALFYRESFKKCKALGEFLETRMQNLRYDGLGFRMQNFHFRANFVHFKRMCDRPNTIQTKNKATLAKLMDDWLVETALELYPDDKSVLEAVRKNRERWASKKMPSMQKKKRGPKPKRKQKAKTKPPVKRAPVPEEPAVDEPDAEMS